MPNRQYYAGTILNGFTILEDLPSEKGRSRVKAICPLCKKEFIGYPKTIKNGECKSCGCLKKIVGTKNLEITHQKPSPKKMYYKGTFINNFYIEEDIPTPEGVEKKSWVKAKCPLCEKLFDVPVKSLKSGNTTSCGCNKKSQGENKIMAILDKENIIYAKEYSFSDLKNKKPLRFDFGIFNNENKLIYLIEYDGIQHFNELNVSWSNADSLLLNQYRDNLKNEYCRQNNIPLIRIPYTHLNNLCLEDLLLETTSFRHC